MPIAVMARPGYDAAALASPAMAWLRRFRRRPASLMSMAKWSGPALVILRFDPDSRSASAIRAADPDWHRRFAPRFQRDAVTHRLLPGDRS
jgi:nicotinate-nucleotide adenylyltransferase